MPRNYIKESDWVKSRYKRYEIRITKSLAAELDALLAQDGVNFSGWVRSKIKEARRDIISPCASCTPSVPSEPSALSKPEEPEANKKSNRMTKTEIAEMLKLHEQGNPHQLIAKILGRDRTAIRRKLAKFIKDRDLQKTEEAL